MHTLIICFTAVACVVTQRFVKSILQPKQYNYFRDILLVGAWLVLTSLYGSFEARVIVGGGLLAGVIGIISSINENSRYNILYFAIGALCAYFGPRINFIKFPDEEYIYLTPGMSFIAETIWFSFFPFIFNYLDEIPGLTGHVLAVYYILMMAVCFVTNFGAVPLIFTGLVLLIAFWSRFGNVYRQAGRALSSIWGIIVGGSVIIGNTNGIILSTVLFLSFGLFAIPIIEIFINIVRGIFADNPENNYSSERIYRSILNNGLEHSEAVQSVALMCALTSIAAAWDYYAVLILVIASMIFFMHSKNKNLISQPVLWGIKLDNVSMNYAISRARFLISSYGDENNKNKNKNCDLIITLNAIGMELALKDKKFNEIINNSSLVLADGAGLRIGLGFLNMPIQERVAGIDFAENLCRVAAGENWPVYFAGAEGDTAEICAEKMAEKFPGLKVAGFRDGYFDVYDANIPEQIKNSGAKILLVAMGQPRQEKWIYRHREILNNILAVGVGGAFDVFSGKLKRAPLWIQKIGFEWLYRMIQEPKRWRKNLKLISFMLRIFATKIGIYN